MSKPIIVRSSVPQKNTYGDYKQELRHDFWYSCAYCSITEVEAQGISFEIDHYKPQKHFQTLKNEYSNLYLSCEICNRQKSEFYSNEQQLLNGIYIIRPDHEDPRVHIQVEDLKVIGKTETGEFNIRYLRLDRPQLNTLRKIRSELTTHKEYISHGINALREISVDQIEVRHRGLFQSMKQRFLNRYENLSVSHEDLIKNFAKSELLDPDPEHKEKSRERRKYLKEINAISI
jgi:uncharacterized protein (TIGR02646 family)